MHRIYDNKLNILFLKKVSKIKPIMPVGSIPTITFGFCFDPLTF